MLTFRRRFLPQIEKLFVQVLLLARETGVLKLGTIGLDGTKIHANASRHSALSYGRAGEIEAQLKAEVAELLARAEAAYTADSMSIPDELALRDTFPLKFVPSNPPVRPELHVQNSIATIRKLLTVDLVKTLARCPCCQIMRGKQLRRESS